MQRSIKMAGVVAAGLNGQAGGGRSEVVFCLYSWNQRSEKLPLLLLLLHKQSYSLESLNKGIDIKK